MPQILSRRRASTTNNPSRLRSVASLGPLLLLFASLAACTSDGGDILEAPPNPDKGFFWSYFLYTPLGLRDSRAHILVVPNNSYAEDDGMAYHVEQARELAKSRRVYADDLGLAVLVPVFPKPKSRLNRYQVHALERDTLLDPYDPATMTRIDLQLIAMIADVRERLAASGIDTDRLIIMEGFSSSAQFVNRFTILHPEIVRAAIGGGAGGYMVPIAQMDGRRLRYPVGTDDYLQIEGHPFDLDAYRQIRQYYYMGSEDRSDPVAGDMRGSSYDPEDGQLILDLLGREMVPRFLAVADVFRGAGCNARFEVVQGIGHEMNRDTMRNVKDFIEDAVR
jgi:predicted esterase